MTYTFELDDVDDKALTAHVADLNVGRVAQNLEPFPDNQSYIGFRVRDLLAPVREQFNAIDLAETIELLKSADLKTRADVHAALEKPSEPLAAPRQARRPTARRKVR